LPSDICDYAVYGSYIGKSEGNCSTKASWRALLEVVMVAITAALLSSELLMCEKFSGHQKDGCNRL